MQRLIIVRLRNGDIIFKSARNRLPHRVDHAQNFIAVLDVFHYNTHGCQIVNLIKRAIVVFHLFIDAVKVFRSAADFAFNVQFL